MTYTALKKEKMIIRFFGVQKGEYREVCQTDGYAVLSRISHKREGGIYVELAYIYVVYT